jgi:hypothetical protein
LGGRKDMSVRASMIAKHSAENYEEVGERWLEKEIDKFGDIKRIDCRNRRDRTISVN